METVSALCSCLSLWSCSLLLLKNLMFFTCKSFVLLIPVTDKYSHDRMAKKKAPMNRSHIVFSRLVVVSWWNFLRMEPVTAACWVGGLSVLEKCLNCLCKMNEGFPSALRVGSSCPAIL